MKRRTLSVLLSLVIALVFVFTLTACGGGGANEVKLDKTELNLSVGEEYTLTATTDPESAAKNLKWHSDDTSVVTVTDGGKVKGVGFGYASVWAESENGVRGYCNIGVKYPWQWAYENTAEQTNYTVTTVEDLGIAPADGGAEMYGTDVTHTVKFDKDSGLYSESKETSFTQAQELKRTDKEQKYGVYDGDSIYIYSTYDYDSVAEHWYESDYSVESQYAESMFIGLAANVAFSTLMGSYKYSDDNSYTLEATELAKYVNYDASSNKVTLSGVSTDWFFRTSKTGSIYKECDAELEIILENNLVKSYTISLSRTYSYFDAFSTEPENGDPANVKLYGTITGTVVYGDTQVAISPADQPKVDNVKANRALKHAFNAFYEDEQNFTLYIDSDTTRLGTAQYSVTKAGGGYSLEGTGVNPKYITVVGDGEDNLTYTEYYTDGSSWSKSTGSGNGLYNTAVIDAISMGLYLCNQNVPHNEYPESISGLYGNFTKVNDSTYTANLFDRCYDHTDEALQQSVYRYVSCTVTVKLDSRGRLSSIECDYGANADGNNFKNLKYTFTKYGSTRADDVPQSVIDATQSQQ